MTTSDVHGPRPAGPPSHWQAGLARFKFQLEVQSRMWKDSPVGPSTISGALLEARPGPSSAALPRLADCRPEATGRLPFRVGPKPSGWLAPAGPGGSAAAAAGVAAKIRTLGFLPAGGSLRFHAPELASACRPAGVSPAGWAGTPPPLVGPAGPRLAGEGAADGAVGPGGGD